jgi:nucleotide-binding universal stress UspA family protein
MKKIAVGIDVSPGSELAARDAVEIGRRTGAEVVLIHASGRVELPLGPAEASETARAASRVYRDHILQASETARHHLAALSERLGGAANGISHMLVEDYADTGLCRVAREIGADLIVVGSQGRSGLRWKLLGSVAQRLVRLSAVDVLLVRDGDRRPGGFRRILVSTDFSPTSIQALDRAIELGAEDAEIQIVHYHWVPPLVTAIERGALGPPRDLESAVEDELRARGAALVSERQRPGRRLEFHLVRERPVPGVIHRLEADRFDLVALGSHGRRGLPRAILGSVAESVMRHAPCSVLVGRLPGSERA